MRVKHLKADVLVNKASYAALASLKTVEKGKDFDLAREVLAEKVDTYQFTKLKMPTLPDRFKIKKKYYDERLEAEIAENDIKKVPDNVSEM